MLSEVQLVCEWKVDQCEERESLITAERGLIYIYYSRMTDTISWKPHCN